MSKKKKTTVAEKLQQKLKKQGKDVSVEFVEQALAANAAAKKAKRQQKGQELKDYVKFRIDRSKKNAEAGINLIKGFKNPGNWADAAKTVIEGEVENVKKLKDLINHPSYYEHYAGLLDQMITPNMARIEGTVDDLIQISNSENASDYPFFTGTDSIPTVAGINLQLVRGSESKSFRMGIDRLYQTIQNINNGNPVGDLEDLAAYIMNFRACIAAIEQGKRAYGALKKFRLTDDSVPMAYFAAFGLDYQSFRNNAANLRNQLNGFMDEINNKAMFELDLFKRTQSLFSTAYADNPTIKHSEYVFRPLSVEYVTENGTIDVVSLCNDALGATNTGLDYDGYISRVQTLVDSLYSNTIYKNLRANILKAEGMNIFQLEYIPEDYIFPSAYNEYMLTQIQNATLIGEAVGYTSNLIGGTTSELIKKDEKLQGTLYRPAQNYLEHDFFNIYKDKISNSELISNLRLTTLGYLNEDGYQCVDIFGTEVPCEIVIPEVVKNAEAENTQYDLKLFRLHLFLSSTYDSVGGMWDPQYNAARWPFLWAVFDWMPMIGISYLFVSEDIGIGPVYRTIMWDFANYGTVDRNKSSLKFYHNVAVRNLLYSELRYQVKDTSVIPTK